jgi:hypothetical protein
MIFGKLSGAELSKGSTSRYRVLSYQFLAVLFIVSLIAFIFISMHEEITPDRKTFQTINHTVANFNIHVTPISKSVSRYRMSAVTSVDDQYQAPKVFLTFRDVFTLLAEDNYMFTNRFISNFLGFESKSYFFECIPVTKETFDTKEFEFVLIAAPPLDEVAADSEAFSQHFKACKDNKVIAFPNLGRDAVLVVPCPQTLESQEKVNDYAHLARFMRSQKREFLHEFWNTVAKTVVSVIDDESRPADMKLWLSTSGLGVYWLHMRLDQRPKYYNFDEYKV